uniref:Prepilin-type N-terminal cleavage/methylation domain-containing protein n=1 Tax=Desulfacinum infernum TaxID=35837 RepID=A0A832A1S3_9BACT
MDLREGRHQQARPKYGAEFTQKADPARALSMLAWDHEAFSLVELMVTVAIVAILAAVAIPAYVNSVRRSEQAYAVEALLRARMELEAFWADHNRYAQTLTLLPSFESATQGKYVISLRVWADGQRYRLDAVRPDVGDRLHLSDNETKPVLDTPKALGWSIFQWLFD